MTKGETIKCKAAVAWEAGKPMSIEEIEVHLPALARCASRSPTPVSATPDAYTLSGSDPEGAFPAILGHEGAGIVESVGEGVDPRQGGRFGYPALHRRMPRVQVLQVGKTNLCQAVRATQGQGVMPDKTKRFSCKGKQLFHFMGCSTFSQYTVVSQYSLVAIDPKHRVTRRASSAAGYYRLGCCYPHRQRRKGLYGGRVRYRLCRSRRAHRAVDAGASRIIAIDTNDAKESWAKKFGATEFVNPTKLGDKDIVSHLVEITDGVSTTPLTAPVTSRSCEAPSRPATRVGVSAP